MVPLYQIYHQISNAGDTPLFFSLGVSRCICFFAKKLFLFTAFFEKLLAQIRTPKGRLFIFLSSK